jgi:hypothetical protein
MENESRGNSQGEEVLVGESVLTVKEGTRGEGRGGRREGGPPSLQEIVERKFEGGVGGGRGGGGRVSCSCGGEGLVKITHV